MHNFCYEGDQGRGFYVCKIFYMQMACLAFETLMIISVNIGVVFQ